MNVVRAEREEHAMVRSGRRCRSGLGACALLLWGLAAGSTVVTAAEPAAAPQVTPQMLEAALQREVERGAPGLSAAIATRRGVVWTGVAGRADLERDVPVDEAHVFGIGSITKVFVVATVLQLAEEGKVDLQAPIGRLLDPAATAGIANADTATVAQLMDHSAGIPSWEDDPVWIREGRGSGLDVAQRWGKQQTLDYIRGPGHPPLHAPGSAYSYANTHHTLLGLLIERVTGRSAESEVRRRILQPLGLESTWLEGFEPGRPELLPRRYHYATPEFLRDAGVAAPFREVWPGLIDASASNLSVEWTAGGMVTTPRDLAEFMRALRDGRLLKPESLRFMTRWTQPAGGGGQVGHGLFRDTRGDEASIGHTGSVLGFTGSAYWLEREDAIVVVLSNVGTMHSGKVPVSASSVARDSEFAALARRYAVQTGATQDGAARP